MLNLISDEERKKRLEAVRYANASIALEGCILSDNYKELSCQFIEGAFDFPVFLEKTINLAQKRLNNNGA